ncbi:MAG: DNA primase DnaG [Candidatus Woesearchaeota archaeon]
MGKISPVSAKYIIHASIFISGVVDKPDVIGAIFGQTEGLLGADLELRELQRSGRIGRIEVNAETRTGKTIGNITIPSSLDKAETAIVAAALEVIQRIGPCTAKIKVENIEDVRVSKRAFVIERAKELLKNLMETTMPDSQELADEVAYSVRVMEIQEYGKDRLPAGPSIDESDEIIVVEGRADVLNLLKHGIKNAVAMNGTSVPEGIIELCKRKIVTAFVDGDRGGDLIIKELTTVAEIDYVTRAPDGKEVEEITKKEIHKALRSRVSVEQAKEEISAREEGKNHRPERQPQRPPQQQQQKPQQQRPQQTFERVETRVERRQVKLSDEEKNSFSLMLEDLIGTRGAYLLNEKLTILGKVPLSELIPTIKSLSSGIYAVVFDGVVEQELVQTAEKADIKFLVGMESKVKGSDRVAILTAENF